MRLLSHPARLAAGLVVLASLSGPAAAQLTSPYVANPAVYRGSSDWIARGVMDGNLIETNFRNFGYTAQVNDNPWGIWPRGTLNRHFDANAIVVGGRVTGQRPRDLYPNAAGDTLLTPTVVHYGSLVARGPTGDIWSWLPLREFHNPDRRDPRTGRLEPTPALSDDETSWPRCWPDKLEAQDPGWCGQWNGLFGKGVRNADLEAYYVIDDMNDETYQLDPAGNPYSPYGLFYPDPADRTKGGFGLQVRVRALQYANVLAEDALFILYQITNAGGTNYDDVPLSTATATGQGGLYFMQMADSKLGNEEFDERAAYDPINDVVYMWDADDIGINDRGETYELGTIGYAFLESPSDAEDGRDNDQDGIVDETRDGGPGALITGQEAIRSAALGSYNFAQFRTFYNEANGTSLTAEQVLERLPAYQAGVWWTGDEDLDWRTFEDEDGDGVLDPDELVNDDVGLDGLGPNSPDYPGPDIGEGNGRPDPGEPNFDRLDVEEGDQLGLTGFLLTTRPEFLGSGQLADDTWLWDYFERAIDGFNPSQSAFIGDVEPFVLWLSGPVGLDVGQTDFFSTAIVLGFTDEDFFENRRTVQRIYNNDYRFAQPPITPTLTAVPGNGQVTLSWDAAALESFDQFTKERDFEGFRLYRGTDNLLSDTRLVTDVNGVPTYWRPIAQWDLDNDVAGTVPTLGSRAAPYNLGSNSGLRFSYVDDDVRNGVTYYYALVAYDRGFTPAGSTLDPVDPQETTFNIAVDAAGNVINLSRNAAAVVPRANALGYQSGDVNEDLSSPTGGEGAGALDVRIVNDLAVREGGTYRVVLSTTPTAENDRLYETTGYSVIDLATRDTLVKDAPFLNRRFLSPEEAPLAVALSTLVVGGVEVTVKTIDDSQVRVDTDGSGWRGTAGGEVRYRLDPSGLNDVATTWRGAIRFPDQPGIFIRSADDYELRWFEDNVYKPVRGTGTLRDSINVLAVNVSTGQPVDLAVEDRDRSGGVTAGDALLIYEAEGEGLSLIRRYRHQVELTVPEGEPSVAPEPGAVFRVHMLKPLREGTYFDFTVRPPTIGEVQAEALENIRVVPNPLVVTAPWDRNQRVQGFTERRIQFRNLPSQCTIRIYNVRGELMATLNHDGMGGADRFDGDMFWDLKTPDLQEVAYGIYVYHVEAPGIGEHMGQFALIK